MSNNKYKHKKIQKKKTVVAQEKKEAVKLPAQTSATKKGFGLASYALIALVLLTFISLSPILRNEFVNYDDNKMIYENRFVNQGKDITLNDILHYQLFQAHYKPLVILMWNWEYQLGGQKPFLFHLNNLLLHILATIVLYFVIMSFLKTKVEDEKKRIFISFFTALLFGIHPLHVESVAWATERKDTLYALFFMLCILFFQRYLGKGFKIKHLLLSTAFYFLSVLSKSPSITLVAVCFFLYLEQFKGNFIQAGFSYLRKAFPLVIIFFLALYLYGLIGGIKSQAVGIVGGVSVSSSSLPENLQGLPSMYVRFIIVSYRFVFWIAHTLLPIGLSVDYPRQQFLAFPGQAIHLLPLLTLFLFFIAYKFRNHKVLGAGIIFYTITIIPALSISDVGTGLFLSDRYSYVPSVGILLIVSYWLIEKVKKWGTILAVGISIITAIMCYQRSLVWRTSETLFLDVIEKYPRMVPLAYNNLGMYYKEKNMLDEAEKYYKESTTFSNYTQSFINLANVYFSEGKYRSAIPYYTKALQLKSNSSEAYSNRGACYFQLNVLDSALADFNKALEISRNFTDALRNRGLLLLNTGKYNEAIEDYNRYLSFYKKDHEVLNARGVAYQNLKQWEKAIEDFNQAIQVAPKNGQYYANRSFAWYNLKNIENAKKDILVSKQLGSQINPQYLKLLGL